MLSWFAARGHDVTVLAGSGAPRPYTSNGVSVRKFDPYDRPSWVHIYRDADVVLTHLDHTFRARRLAKIYEKPIADIFHNDRMPIVMNTVTPANTSLAIFNSRWIADRLRWPARHCVVRPLVTPERYAASPGKAITLVNLYHEKGPHVLYELARRMPGRAFRAVHGGYGEQVIERLPNVEHVGTTPDMRAVYGGTRVLLMPSVYESWGRVGIEAACSGVPTIAAPTPGLHESLGPAGTFIDRDDIDGWQRAIEELDDPAVYSRMSALARERAAYWPPVVHEELEELESQLGEVIGHGARRMRAHA